MQDVGKFINTVSNVQRQYFFRALLAGAPGITGAILEKTSALVESTRVPTKTIVPVDSAYMGVQVKLAGNVEYPDWECVYRVDKELDIYTTIYEWMEKVRRVEDNKLGLATDYKRDIVLQQLDGYAPGANPTVIGTYTLKGAWPTNLGEITLDTQSAEKQTLPVTYAFDYFTYEPVR
jgi:hypothetical protein